MSEKHTSVSEQFLRELMDSDLNWMTTAQVLAYLATGINGHNAEDTLRIGRAKLGKLFEDINHDLVCWREIAERQDASPYIREFALGRVSYLQSVLDKAHKRFETMTEGRHL